jgi:hypothetical protein
MLMFILLPVSKTCLKINLVFPSLTELRNRGFLTSFEMTAVRQLSGAATRRLNISAVFYSAISGYCNRHPE